MSYWRKKPIVIEAFQWTGGDDQTEDPEWFVDALQDRRARITKFPLSMHIDTLEGVHVARPGCWIIRGVQGELYPCQPDIFAATYEQAYGEFETLCDTCVHQFQNEFTDEFYCCHNQEDHRKCTSCPIYHHAEESKDAL